MLRVGCGSDRLALVSEDEPETSDWQPTALFTAEDVESAVTRAGQIVYGSDARLDHLVKETRRLLAQRRQRPTIDPDQR
jgi:hypothetical protein